MLSQWEILIIIVRNRLPIASVSDSSNSFYTRREKYANDLVELRILFEEQNILRVTIYIILSTIQITVYT